MDFLEKDYEDVDEVIQDLITNFFPEATVFEVTKWEKGLSKYTWNCHIILEYYNQKYLFKLLGFGNCSVGWCDTVHDIKVVSEHKVKNYHEEKVITCKRVYNLG